MATKKIEKASSYLKLILAVDTLAELVNLDGDLLVNTLDTDKDFPAVGSLALELLLQKSLTAGTPGPVAELALGMHQTSHGDELSQGSRVGGVTLEAGGVLLSQELGRVLARAKAVVRNNLTKKRNVVRDTLDDIRVKSTLHVLDGLVTGGTVGAELADHGVVVNADLTSFNNTRVAADFVLALGRGGLNVLGETADGGKVLLGILGVDTGLDGPSVDLNVRLLGDELLVGSDTDHLLDQVHTSDVLGNRVLDLKTGVHLQEVEVAGRVDQELDSSGRRVLDVLGKHDGLLTHSLAGLLINVGRGSLLNNLLVSALDGTLSLRQVELLRIMAIHGLESLSQKVFRQRNKKNPPIWTSSYSVAVLVGNDLDLNVARVVDELFNQETVITEGGHRLGLGNLVALLDLLIVPGDTHTLSSTSSGGLEHDGVSNLTG